VRGGRIASSCFILHDTPIKTMHLVVSASGKALPQASGASGGYPGNTQYDVITRDSSVRASFVSGRVPGDLDQLGGTPEEVPPEYETDMSWDDVYYTNWQGGGGYGDPLMRDPNDVVRDVAEEKVSPRGAREAYGVVLARDGSVDETATLKSREESRVARGTGANVARGRRTGEEIAVALRMDDNLVVGVDRIVRCAHCGTTIGERGKDQMKYAVERRGEPTIAGPNIRGTAGKFVDEIVVFKQQCCPGCNVALLTEIVPADEQNYRTREV
jgi:N-methylhydantoinase B